MTFTEKRFVCLAISRMPGGRCVAGIELNDGRPGNWVRMVNDTDGGAVAKRNIRCEDDGFLELLDVVSVPLVSPVPIDHQTENWAVHTDCRWQRGGYLEWSDLDKLIDPIADLWTVGHGSKPDRNDMVEPAKAVMFDHSLRLVKLSDVRISVRDIFKRPVRAHFLHNGNPYGLKVTDPNFERKYRDMGFGDYEIGECYATISLAQPYQGNCFKLAATIFEPPAR